MHLLTPVALHADQVELILDSGRHCASAVPMATTLADCDRLIAAEERSGRNYMMMETAVYSREYFHARRLLDDGRLGRLSYFRGEHLQNLDGYPPYWLGYPPMHYVTHALSPALALAGARVDTVRCLGSSRLTPDHVGVGGEGYGTEAALFRLAPLTPEAPVADDLVANITMSFFQLGRSLSGGLLGVRRRGCAGVAAARGRADEGVRDAAGEPGPARPAGDGRRCRPAGAAERLPEPLRLFADGGHGGSHPHLVHEFVSSIVEGRPSRIDARQAATFTAPGICAHASALAGGEEVAVPDFRVPEHRVPDLTVGRR